MVTGAHLTKAQVCNLLARSLKYGFAGPPRLKIESAARETPAVSVIIATYNWSSVLRYAIQSVLWQREQNFEILVIGDACTDDSEAVARSFGDARVRCENLPVNSGSQSSPNNAGIAMARGRYVAYLGHDDIWHPAHLSGMLEAAESSKADAVFSLVQMIGPQGTDYRVVTGVGGGRNGFLPPSGLMHRREIAEAVGWWPDYRTVQRNPDVEFVHRIRDAGYRFAATHELTVYKFNSAMRKNSYVEKPCHEQAEYVRRIQRDRWFQTREALKIARVHWNRRPMRDPGFAPPPDENVKGWYVTQYRKYRGLE